MSTYIDMGASPNILAAPDTTGRNPGNLTTVVDDVTLGGMKINVYELWHMCLVSVPVGGQARILFGGSRNFGFVFPFGGSEWWGRLPMRQSDTLYFLWNLAATVTPVPVLTCYMQYDADHPSNRGL